jgi:hypothetical protein
MCERVALPDGGFAVVCGGHRGRRRRCVHCRYWAEFECDACARPLCRRCRSHVPPNQDFCKAHRREASAAAAQLRLFNEAGKS